MADSVVSATHDRPFTDHPPTDQDPVLEPTDEFPLFEGMRKELAFPAAAADEPQVAPPCWVAGRIDKPFDGVSTGPRELGCLLLVRAVRRLSPDRRAS